MKGAARGSATLMTTQLNQENHPSSASSLKCSVSQRIKTDNPKLLQIFSTQQISLDALLVKEQQLALPGRQSWQQ
jgi:hypothetical protein